MSTMKPCAKCRKLIYAGVAHTCPDSACYYHVPLSNPAPSSAHPSQPAQTVDVGAIREVIDALRNMGGKPNNIYNLAADKLTRALAGEKAGPVDGWKLVPSDPTQSMTVAGFECDAWDELSSAVVHTGGWPFSCRESAACVTAIYKAMLAASPAPDKEGNSTTHGEDHGS